MQNSFRDHDFVPMNPDFAKEAPELMSSKLAFHERPVLRGSVIAESEQDLAELLSRYQQGYYRPNEAAVALLSDQTDPSKYVKANKESCGLKESLQDASRTGGGMMQLRHVAKARLLMRHPSSQYTNSSPPCSNAPIPRSINSRDLQFRAGHRMPFSFNSMVHPDRTQFQDLTSGSYQNGMMVESHWMDPMSFGSGLDWSQREGDYAAQGFGVESGLLDPFNSNSCFGNQLHPSSDFPMSSVISKKAQYHYAQSPPYQSMIPNPSSFQNSRDWNDPFRSLDAPFTNPGCFLDSRMESLSAQHSTRSSQDRLTSFNCYGIEDNGIGSNFEFLEQVLPPETSFPTRSAPISPTRGRMTRQSRSRKQIPTSQTPGTFDDNTGSHWLLETLARLPVDADQSESCLIWNNDPAESFLLSTENSFNEKSCSTDLRSENNNHHQSEASKLLEQTGLNFQDPVHPVDISHKLSDILAKSQPSKYSKEDVLELAFCTLGKWTASIEDLQNVCKVWNSSVSKLTPKKESFTEDLQFQTSLDSWLGLKHVRSFSRGSQGLRSIQNCLQKDSRFIQQEDNIWSCVNPFVDCQDSTEEVPAVSAAKRKSSGNKRGKEFSKRKKNDSELQYNAEGYNQLVNDNISHHSIEVSKWNLFERSRFQQ